MSFTPAKIPTTREELSFKVTEEYENLLNLCEKGSITEAQLDCAVRSLIRATGWAVSKEVFIMLSEADTDYD